MQIDKDSSFRTAEEAINYLYKNDYVTLYDTDDKRLRKEIHKLYEMIKEKNSGIEDIDYQILLTNPYYFRGIDGCLGVQCAEIDCGLYKDNHGCIAMFSGWNSDVLHGDFNITPSSKALASLAMLGNFL